VEIKSIIEDRSFEDRIGDQIIMEI
jgi:hypothetical protein